MKRWIFELVVFLLLGAIVNVGVAWGSALGVDGMAPERFPHQQRGLTNKDHPRWRVLLTPGISSTVVQSGATRNPYPRGPLPADATKDEIDAWLRGEAVRVPNDVVSVPYWSRASTPPTESEYESPGVWEDARGWPMRSLVWHWVRRFSDGTDRRRWAFDLGEMQGPIGLPRALPLRPIPVGFVVSSLLYATCVWLLVAVPLELRSMIRRKRGRCLKCGYDLRGAEHEVCPECGWVWQGFQGVQSVNESDQRITTICLDPSAVSSYRIFNTNDWHGASREIVQSCTTQYSALEYAVDHIAAACSNSKERCQAHFETLRNSIENPSEIAPKIVVYGQVSEVHVLIQAFFSGMKSLLDIIVQLISSENIVGSHVRGFNRDREILGGRVLNALSNNVVSGRTEVAQHLSALITEHKESWIDEVIESRDLLIHPKKGAHLLMFDMELAVVDGELVYNGAVPPSVGDEPIDRYTAKRLANIKEFSVAFLGAIQK